MFKKSVAVTIAIVFFCVTLQLLKSNIESKQRLSKIIGLVPVRNEALMIEQCLRALSCYVDEIIVLNDASEDDTLAILKNIAQICNISVIINKEIWSRHESVDRNMLLSKGRARGGTHFVVIDADEMFTANFLEQDLLRTTILRLQPGDSLCMHWIRLWKDIYHFKINDAELKTIIFCDDGKAFYPNSIIHTPRVPTNLQGKVIDFGQYWTHGLLHFQAVNWHNMLMRQVWYQCFERIHNPSKDPKMIASAYKRVLEMDSDQITIIDQCPPYWFEYPFFNRQSYERLDVWREHQVQQWIQQYGLGYFKDLLLWDN